MNKLDLINKIKQLNKLSINENEYLFSQIMNGELSDDLIEGILIALAKKGECSDEITGGALVLRDKSLKVHLNEDAIDTCGTGGDGKHTLNISTASALVLASMGLKVAKHGNKSLTSKCGSADVLEKLGISIMQNPDEVKKSIEEKNFGFMFAPNYHSAMKNVANVRKKIKLRTIFNLLGPLANPALVKRQCIGVFSNEILDKYISEKSILGICLGHQIIAQALGGKIIRAKKLMHGKLSKIQVFQSKIFNNFPKYIIGARYHSLIVDNKKIPKDLIITAITKDNIIMGLSHKDYDVHGIQFHPESIKTNMGKKIIKNFLT